ncbi:MAG: alpha/beta hydrolase [Fluviicola sp.]|nr:MAG: alpha/beta hydrolase [Fluviicola sp.]
MKLENAVYTGANERDSLIDLEIPEKLECKHLILFVHGYKGYKDWGAWHLVQNYFVERGIGFCKFNLSHNGGTTENPIDFPDLEAFAENRYTYEVEDIACALDWIEKNVDLSEMKVHLIGHSRGGADVILAGKDERVDSITTWASISNIEKRFPEGEELEKWRETGVRTVKNSRTNQDMPHNFSMYEDWELNKSHLDIEAHARALELPSLHLHGDIDDAVSIIDSENLSSWTGGKLIVISDGNHTFGSKHPWTDDSLPPKLYEVCSLSRQFIEKIE